MASEFTTSGWVLTAPCCPRSDHRDCPRLEFSDKGGAATIDSGGRVRFHMSQGQLTYLPCVRVALLSYAQEPLPENVVIFEGLLPAFIQQVENVSQS